MTNQTKILLFLGGLALVYFLSNKRNKKPRNIGNNPQQEDSLRSSYNVIPLPDIKGYTFSSIPTAQVVGQTSSSPIIIARPSI
jgi:hypothetical protein